MADYPFLGKHKEKVTHLTDATLLLQRYFSTLLHTGVNKLKKIFELVSDTNQFYFFVGTKVQLRDVASTAQSGCR